VDSLHLSYAADLKPELQASLETLNLQAQSEPPKEQDKAVLCHADLLSDVLIQPPKITHSLIVITCPGISDNHEVRMATKEDILNEKTNRDLPLAQRIYYTLTDNEKINAKQTAKTLGLLIENLVNKGILISGRHRRYAV
jgi:hypothetical protein